MSANVAIISATVAVVMLVLAIFGASWLNHNIEKVLDQLEKRFDARFDTVLTEIKRLDQRIDSVERRLDRMERQLEAVFRPVPPARG